MVEENGLESLMQRIRACRICRDCPRHGGVMPHEPRPILQAGTRARICVASQAPGNRAHHKGLPFHDPSGERLREWLGVTRAEFYNPEYFAIVPMGFCFPGYDARGGDLGPRRECAETWHPALFDHMVNLDLILVIGQYAQRYHLPERHRHRTLTETVANWRQILEEERHPVVLPMPHPSWRNNAWLRRNPWFSGELLPELQRRVRALISRKPRDNRARPSPFRNGP